ncbi:zinc knuckle [Ostertagia ostertagi]
MTEHTWMMQDILKDLDQVIETEEQIKHMMQRTSNTSRPSTKSTENGAKYAQKAGIFCIFCAASDHKSLLCTKYASPEDRKKMFLDQDRCLNCGTPGHFTKACTKEGCRLCDGKKHHHTLCPIRMKSMNTTQARPEHYRKEPCTTPTQSEGNKRSAHSGLGRQQPKKPATVQAHAVDTEACTTRLNGSQGSDHSDNLTAVLSTVRNQGIPCGNEAEARIPASNISTNVTPPSDKTGRNDMAKSRARTRPYNLRPRTPKSDAQEVNTATVVSNARRLTPKWFLFHIMILSLIQVCSGCATSPGGLVCAKKGFYYITTAPQALDTCANGLKNTQNIHRCVHLVEIQTELFFKEKLFLQYIASDSCANFHVNNKSASLFQKNLGASIGLRILTIIWLALSIYLPMANSLCIIQARRKKLPHNVSEVEKQLHQAQTSLHKLKSAIPPLPEPNVLYEKIVELCTDHYNHTQAVTSIEEKVRRLRSSDKPSQQRITEISSINLEIDYISLQFRFCRSQLLTLFSLPPLLIAMDKMTKQHWETLMSQPQEVSHNKPLIVDMDSLEEITSDQIQVLNSLRSTLNDFRIQAQNDADNEHFAFEKEVRDKLDQIQKLTLGFQDAVMDRLRERPLVANQGAGEGIRRIREENDIIRDNEGFIEGVMEMDESEAEDVEQEPDDQDSDDEDMDHNAEHDDLLETEDSEEERDEQEPEERESDDEELDRNHIPDDIPQREDRRRSAIQIEQEIRSAEQAVRNFEEILQQYEHEPLCPPRRFGQGHITKGYERFMKCAFCEAIGIHYSDSCTALRDPYTRRELIRSTGRCRMCLERVCARGATCRKYLTACYYCRERGHHSSLCDFPDQSDYIRSRLENAREGRIRSLIS